MTGKRIAVLGAGYVGAACARAAAAAGHAVWAVRRSAPAAVGADGVHWIRGDATAGHVADLPASLDIVVLAVAPRAGTDQYHDIYPPAARGAVAIARASGAARLVYTSSTGVYGGRDGALVTETSSRAGGGDSAAALIEAEDAVLGAHGVDATVLRVAGIYGPGRDPRPRFRQAGSLPERGEYWVNLAHRDDIVAAILHVPMFVDAPAVLNVSDGAFARAADVCRWLARDEGTDESTLVFGNDAPASRNNQRVSNAALVATGWVPQYASFREGFARGL